MNITCLNPNCRNQIQISGPWLPAATCANCGTVHYPPFSQSGAAPAPPVPVPISPPSDNNAPMFPPISGGYMPPVSSARDWNREPTPTPTPTPTPPGRGWNPNPEPTPTPTPPGRGWNPNPEPTPTPTPPGRGWNPVQEPVKTEPIATLMAENALGQRQEFKLKLGANFIGRATADLQVDIVLTDASISRPHCVVEVLENKPNGWKYMLYDISYTNRKESTNGVYIPFRATRLSRLEQIELQVGSYFIAGNIKLELR